MNKGKFVLILAVLLVCIFCVSVWRGLAANDEPQIWVKEYNCDTIKIGYSGFTTDKEYPGWLWVQNDSSIYVTLYMESPGTLYGTFDPQCEKPKGGYVLVVYIYNLETHLMETVYDLETPKWEECETIRLPMLKNSQ